MFDEAEWGPEGIGRKEPGVVLNRQFSLFSSFRPFPCFRKTDFPDSPKYFLLYRGLEHDSIVSRENGTKQCMLDALKVEAAPQAKKARFNCFLLRS